MKTRTLGRTGLDIAPLVLGGNVFGGPRREGVTAPIASATRRAHVESFAKAARLVLSPDDMAIL